MLRARSGAPLLSAKRFRRRLDLISPQLSGAGRWVVVPHSTHRRARPAYLQARRFERSQRRRRRLLLVLVLGVVGTAVAAVLGGQMALQLHFGVDAALAFYVGALLEVKRRRRARAYNVDSVRVRRNRTARRALIEPLRAAGGRG